MKFDVSKNGNLAVGTKQALKAVTKSCAQEVYIAGDADQRLVKDLVELCHSQNVPVIMYDTMAELGATCGIQVGTASAARLKE